MEIQWRSEECAMHVAKYTKPATGHMFKHYERAKDDKGEYVKFGNQDIDLSRTPLNYNLAPDHDQLEYLHERLNQVKCQKRADVNVFCDWVITAPKELPQQHTREFFEMTYKFMSERYGANNVISAYVHMDETTPHMHFCFIPVVKAKNKKGEEIEKVSAKIRLSRTELQHFHPDLQKYLEQKLGIDVPIMNGATKSGNKTVTELKLQSLQEQTEKEEMKRKFYKAQTEKKQQEFTDVSKQVRQLKDEQVHLTARNEEQAQELESLQERIKTAQDELTDLNDIKLPAIRSELIQSQLERRRVQESIIELQQQKNEIENRNSQLKSELENESKNLKNEIGNLKNENQFLKSENEKLQKNISYHKQILSEKSKELSQIQKSISTAKNELMEIFNHAKNQFVKIISVADKLKNAEELTEKTRGYYNEKVDRTEAEPQLKEKSKALINETAEQTQEVIRRRKK